MPELTAPIPENIDRNPPAKISSLYVIPILVLGVLLRWINISRYSLWSDEAGQVFAAIAPRAQDFLAAVNRHVMAMPLDYVMTRWMASISMDEAVLRLPALIWGSFAVLFLFLTVDLVLKDHRNGRKISLLTALFLALSPVHIFYSQEIRFYAALTFFYWLNNYLLLRYLSKSTFVNLALLTVFCLIGVYFHPFVFLVYINAALFFFLSKSYGYTEDSEGFLHRRWKVFRSLVISGAIVLAGFFVWFFTQKPNISQEHELFRYAGSFASFLLSGMGWRGYEWCENSVLFGSWEFFLSVTFIIGILFMIRDRGFLKKVLPMLLAYIIQVFLIVMADFLRGYWVALRQIIHLAPFLFVVNAFMLVSLSDRIMERTHIFSQKKWLKFGLNTLVILSVIACAIPKIFEYYHVGKSNARQLIDLILEYQPNPSKVLINPGYNSIVYEIYFKEYYGITGTSFVRTELNNLADFQGSDHFLIAQVLLTADDQQQIDQYYDLISMPETRCFGDRALYRSK